jgi:hypothetical protein
MRRGQLFYRIALYACVARRAGACAHKHHFGKTAERGAGAQRLPESDESIRSGTLANLLEKHLSQPLTEPGHIGQYGNFRPAIRLFAIAV